ncbi:PREDICTED: C-type lectin domain family 4 member G-like [Galeopterus variegatus]|uniref:C-type lectin domain family 4 member G-like n=1 Tax=Galeopterus variegatus TaxID=482537 RepID=A0ABM0RCA9_GALVR|nr:PREDICTED: C-type lectin domain family 4 member G-like [Galeopterus variegatus]
MDTTGYRKWSSGSLEVPKGRCGGWEHCRQRPLLLALAVLVTTVLWALILSILLSRASTERGALLGSQDQLRTNVSKQTAVIGTLEEDTRACNSCCLGTRAQLQTTHADILETEAKLIEQESALKELRERMTQGLAESSRDRENIRNELFQTLDAIRLHNGSCEECPRSWLPFEGSCYYFSVPRATWAVAQQHCAGAGAHLVIIRGQDEQNFLSGNTHGHEYWMGLRAVRQKGRIQSYKWIDGVPLSHSRWSLGEPNDAQGREDCVMLLPSGLWNDTPCDEKTFWICKKRLSC